MPAIEVVSHVACLEHQPPLGHPDVPARVSRVLDTLEREARGRWQVDPARPLPPPEDVLGALAWIHDRGYLERFRQASLQAPTTLDSADCPVSRGTFSAAMAAAGLCLQIALDTANHRAWRTFAVVRPAGHHALRDQAKGFCFLNNLALAAEALARAWAAPLLIVDFDVHHGNGIQELFYDRADVGYVSVHRYPFFPGSGRGDEVGEGPGRGTTRNVPLAAGATDDVFATAFEDAIDEVGSRLRPAIILVAAGFDAHQRDPLGGMAVSAAGFKRVSTAVDQASRTWSEGRVLSVLEGGYDLEALVESTLAHLEALAGGC